MADEQKEVKLAGGVFADEEAAIAAASQLAQELAEEPPAEDDGEVVEEALSGTGEDSGEDEDTPPEEESKPDSLTTLLEKMEALHAEIAELKSGKSAEPSPEPEPAPIIQQVTPKEIAVNLTDDDFESLTQDKESASKVLSNLVNNSNRQLAAQLTEAFYQSLPQLVTPLIARMQAGYSAAAEFRNNPANADLVNHKNPRVMQLLVDEGNRLGRANPTWEPAKVFEEAAKSVRRLISPAASKLDEKSSSKPPIKPKGGGGRGGDTKPKLTGLQKELQEAGWRPNVK